MPSHTVTIYVALLNEAVDCWRPVLAARRTDDLYEILSPNDDPDSEQWQFGPGSLVRCERRQFSGGHNLVAVELKAPWVPKPVQTTK